MKWRTEFYHERRGVLVCYGVEASLPAEAVQLGWTALLAEHPTTSRRGRLSLFERAQRSGGQDASGWLLYRIARDSDRGALGAAHAPAA